MEKMEKRKFNKDKRAIEYAAVKEVIDYEELLLNDLLGAPYCPQKNEGVATGMSHRDDNPVIFFDIACMGGKHFLRTS